MIFHQPVLLKETIDFLRVEPGKIFIDATLGGGGHAQEIIRLGGLVIGIDQDPEALVRAQKKLRSACPAALSSKQRAAIDQAPGFDQEPFFLVEDNFANLAKISKKLKITKAAGILFDLGTSYYQLTSNQRGFSFDSDQLDMRMSPKLQVTAADLLAALSEKELGQIFTKFAQEEQARIIAKAIIKERKIAPIRSGKRLAKIIEGVAGRRRGRIHPATKTFQALRIAVNDELGNLEKGLEQAVPLLAQNGRLVIISFHEGEDRTVKNFFHQQEQEKKLTIITKKPIVPKKEEQQNNPRSRSAKLRVAQK
ncbi:MAG: 16S rRNA (cytosine(1402)-N(4))-methyltransferase RsmH [Candidatus Shapirobacteria bacterium]|nr:16S rRNA (cytosine(1402)-N(4))-methyltransferase RsmH [Candidatus Shapirobacteria bacterium]